MERCKVQGMVETRSIMGVWLSTRATAYAVTVICGGARADALPVTALEVFVRCQPFIIMGMILLTV